LLFVPAKVPFDKLRAGSFDKPAAAGKLGITRRSRLPAFFFEAER